MSKPCKIFTKTYYKRIILKYLPTPIEKKYNSLLYKEYCLGSIHACDKII